MLIQPNINILVVEDDITVLQVFRERLLQAGHRVRTAETVKEALQIIQRHPSNVDMMLLSLDLAHCGCLTFVETVQKTRGEILMMVISSLCGPDTLEAIQAGAYDCIRKDASPALFWTKINRAIEAFRLRKQLGVLRRERRAALTHLEQKGSLMAILNSFADGLIVTDWQTNVVFANDAAARLFGLDRKKIYGNPVSSCLTSDELLSFIVRAIKSDAALATFMAGEEPVLKVSDKRLRIHVDPVIDSAGTVVGALALCHDVTKVKAMDKLRSDFLSMVSHELKAPLSSLLMQISVIHDGLAGDLTEKQTDLLGKAKEKTKGMITLVNDLLDYRRIEEGKSIQKIDSLDLADLLSRTVTLMALSADDKGITISTDIARDLPAFSGDRGGMEAIFVNIISNAIKYTPKDGAIAVSLNQAGKDIRFKVVDSGIGIPPEDLQRIFDKFYRIKTKATKSISGSGLGLSIVKGVVDAHNGTIHVESKVGQGTTFIVSLPVSR